MEKTGGNAGYRNYSTDKSEKSINYKYAVMLQKARLDSGLTQEKLAELTDKSLGSIKAYESGVTEPPKEMLKLISDICNAPYLRGEYINQDEIMSDIIPPINTKQSQSDAVIRFYWTFNRFEAVVKKMFEIANGGSMNGEFMELLRQVISDGLALQLAHCENENTS